MAWSPDAGIGRVQGSLASPIRPIGGVAQRVGRNGDSPQTITPLPALPDREFPEATPQHHANYPTLRQGLYEEGAKAVRRSLPTGVREPRPLKGDRGQRCEDESNSYASQGSVQGSVTNPLHTPRSGTRVTPPEPHEAVPQSTRDPLERQ